MKIKKLTLLFALCIGIFGAMTAASSCSLFGNKTSGSEETSSTSSSQEKLEMIEGDFEIMVGGIQEIPATGENITWKSSDESVATVDEYGIVTGVSVGHATITASTPNGESVSCTVVVKRPTIVPVLQMNKDDRIFHVGDAFQLEPTMMFNGKEVAGTYTYESKNATVASVSESGLITANAIGETQVTIVWECFGYKDIESVNVSVVPNAYMELSNFAVGLVEEELSSNTPNKSSEKIEVLSLEIDGQQKDVSSIVWESQDTSVATVSQDGTITAVGAGETYVIATWVEGNMEATANIQVTVLREMTYIVKHIQREFNGKLVIEESLLCSDLIGNEVEITPKTFEGYTYDKSISKNWAKLDEGKDIVLNLYYQTEKEVFEASSIEARISGGQATYGAQEMTNVPAEDVRLGTYFFKAKNPKGAANLTMSYTKDNVGKYLLLQVYYTSYVDDGFHLWTASNDESGAQLVGIYDEDGNAVSEITTNEWLTYVIYMDTTSFPVNGGVGGQYAGSYAIVLTWAHRQVNDFYVGSYCYITESEFNAYYTQAAAPVAEIDLVAPKKED